MGLLYPQGRYEVPDTVKLSQDNHVLWSYFIAIIKIFIMGKKPCVMPGEDEDDSQAVEWQFPVELRAHRV